MSWTALAAARELTNVRSSEKFLMIMLSYAQNEGSLLCCPSIETISMEICRSKRHVQRMLRSLQKRGFITINERKGTSHSYGLDFVDAWRVAHGKTREPDVTSDTMSPVTQLRHPTREPDVIRTVKNRVSSSEELRSSSSSSEEEEDRENFLKLVEARYRPSFFTKDYPGLRSPINAPSRYFKKLRENGDAPASFGLVSTIEACRLIRDALVMDFPEDSPKRKERFTIPMPTDIGGMMEIHQTIRINASSRGTIRRAVFNFVSFDEDNPEGGIDPAKLLTSLSRAPERFVTALENVSRED